MPNQGAKSLVPLTVESIFWPHWTKRADENSQKHSDPATLEPTCRQTEMITPIAKPLQGGEGSCVISREY